MFIVIAEMSKPRDWQPRHVRSRISVNISQRSNAGFSPAIKYVISEPANGYINSVGSSTVVFARKYADNWYDPEERSLSITGRSIGNLNSASNAAENPQNSSMKNSTPVRSFNLVSVIGICHQMIPARTEMETVLNSEIGSHSDRPRCFPARSNSTTNCCHHVLGYLCRSSSASSGAASSCTSGASTSCVIDVVMDCVSFVEIFFTSIPILDDCGCGSGSTVVGSGISGALLAHAALSCAAVDSSGFSKFSASSSRKKSAGL
mmetsp:Transcript_25690/g.64162  ORF Transcript_25690/g.64162 Transcript_25690/m.64162 type:complete len:262 (+) Transcript_25690:491-1276(+)